MSRLPGPATWSDFAISLSAAFDGFVVTDLGMPSAIWDLLAEVAASSGAERLAAADRTRAAWASITPAAPVDAQDARAIVLAAVLPLDGRVVGEATLVGDRYGVELGISRALELGGAVPVVVAATGELEWWPVLEWALREVD